MKYVQQFLRAGLIPFCLSSMPGQIFASPAAGNPASGKIIYERGLLPSGDELTATLHDDVNISGKPAACVNCHRRSGLGSNEGKTVILEISGKTLFSDLELEARRYTRHQNSAATLERPAYTRTTLYSALTGGIRSNGQQLDTVMPKYNLSERDFSHLYAYLQTLSTEFDAGVSDKEFHIATIIDTASDTNRAATMLNTLHQYIKEYNTETRFESKRAKNAPIQKEWHYQNYRKLKLHVWKVDGPTDSWRKQIEKYYSEQPVFALVAGLSDRSWQAVENFCNESEIPCIFPSTILPGESPDNYYTLYYSKGIDLEARVLAKYLADSSDINNKSPVIQLFDDSQASKSAAEAFSTAGSITQDIISLPTGAAHDDLHRYQQQHPDDKIKTLILWNTPESFKDIAPALKNIDKDTTIYTSSLLSQDIDSRSSLAKMEAEAYTTYPYVKPDKLKRKMIRPSVWARSRKLDVSDDKVLGDTFTSVMLLGNALRHLRGNYYRDYVLELLEHKVENAVVTSVYPRLSIGPGQRYASKGAYILKISKDPKHPLSSTGPWIIP